MSLENDTWKANSGQLAWPTVALAMVALGTHLGVLLAHAQGQLGDGLAFAIAALAAYVGFTPLHEASHGNVAGREKKARRLDDLVGWLSGLQLMAPFPAFKVLHLRHHGQTNHPEHDPDMWVAARGRSAPTRALSVLLRCATLLPHYYVNFFVGDASRSKAARTQRSAVIVASLAMLILVGLAVHEGYGGTLLFVWVLPAWLATSLLGLLFDWLPHRSHDVRGRYHDTRAIDAPLGIPMLGQHLHLVHHLYPRVPFYLYRRVFDRLRATLEQKGARIHGLDSPDPSLETC